MLFCRAPVFHVVITQIAQLLLLFAYFGLMSTAALLYSSLTTSIFHFYYMEVDSKGDLQVHEAHSRLIVYPRASLFLWLELGLCLDSFD
jgi:hypothetical protein